MAVLKKFRPRWWSNNRERTAVTVPTLALVPPTNAHYDLRPLTMSQIDECWRLDQRCFLDGEAYSRDTFEYLLGSPESVSYRVVTQNSAMAGFVIGLVEPDHTGHITTIGIAPEHRRRRLASCLMDRVEDGFRQRNVRIVRLEVRATNVSGTEALRQPRLHRHATTAEILFKWRGWLVDGEAARLKP